MLALIALAAWQLWLGALIALLLVSLLHARRWSVKRLVMVRVHYKNGTHTDFITFPWRLKKLYTAIAGNPRTLEDYNEYSSMMEGRWNVEEICLSRFDSDEWCRSIESPSYHKHCSLNSSNYFEDERVLWSRKHSLLVNVLRDFGLEDNQPLPPRILAIAANQRLNEQTMRSVLEKPVNAHLLTDTEVAYLEHLDACLRLTIAKKWERSNRLTCFSGKLPGTDELVMELITTDGGKEEVIAAIKRDWQPKPKPTPPPEPPKHSAGVKC